MTSLPASDLPGNDLPGSDLIETGLLDLLERRETIPALLVLIGAPKLRSLDLDIPDTSLVFASTPEHRLYDLLATANPDSAHSKYNALIRKLVSFERAITSAKK